MSLLTHRVEKSLHSSDRLAPTRLASRWMMIKRISLRALAVLLMIGLLASLIAIKAMIFLPHSKF